MIGPPSAAWGLERVTGVGRGHLGPDARPPARQLRGQFAGLLRVLLGQVVGLPRVAPQVEQLDPAGLERLDELPVPLADRPARPAELVAVVRIMPVERPGPRRLAPGQEPGQAHAVEPLDRGQSAGLGDRDREVRRPGRRGLDPRRDPARPPGDQGDPDAPLVDPALPHAQGRVVRRRRVRPLAGGQAAVVAGEDDQRPIGDPRPFDGRDHPADGVVQALEHRRVDRVLLPAVRGPVPLRVLRDRLGPGDHRRVDRVVRQVEEERGGLVPLDEPLGLDPQPVGQVLALGGVLQPRHRSVPAPERGHVAERRAGVIPRDVDVEPLLRRLESGPPEVPLADHPRGVPGALEPLGQRDLLERQGLAELRPVELLRGPVRPAREPVGQVEPGRVLAGHQGRAGGRADRARGIRLGEAPPPGGQPVEVRGPMELAPVTAEVRPPQVIRDDQDDVRPILGRDRPARGHRKPDRQPDPPTVA